MNKTVRGQMILPVYGDYVGEAIKNIQRMEMIAKAPLCLRFSGGKDSVVTKWLCEQAGIQFRCRFSPTTVDPPEALKFLRKYHQDVIWDRPRISMKKLIVKKGFPPTRVCRYCCREFKERNTCGKHTWTCTGVRKEESRRRADRNMYETCRADQGIRFFHPIINWTEEQIWKVIEDNHIPYCSIYDEGFRRLGCVGCPLTSGKQIKREFERWPQIEKRYMQAFEEMLIGRNFDKWKTASDVMDWYIWGSEKKYEKLDLENQQMSFRDIWKELYYGDYFDTPTYEGDLRQVEDAKIILH